jgi:hypothetical protein
LVTAGPTCARCDGEVASTRPGGAVRRSADRSCIRRRGLTGRRRDHARLLGINLVGSSHVAVLLHRAARPPGLGPTGLDAGAGLRHGRRRRGPPARGGRARQPPQDYAFEGQSETRGMGMGVYSVVCPTGHALIRITLKQLCVRGAGGLLGAGRAGGARPRAERPAPRRGRAPGRGEEMTLLYSRPHISSYNSPFESEQRGPHTEKVTSCGVPAPRAPPLPPPPPRN